MVLQTEQVKMGFTCRKANDIFGYLTPITCEMWQVIIPDLTELAAEDLNLLPTELHSGFNSCHTDDAGANLIQHNPCTRVVP